jgi:hypothetical protein
MAHPGHQHGGGGAGAPGAHDDDVVSLGEGAEGLHRVLLRWCEHVPRCGFDTLQVLERGRRIRGERLK